MLLRGEEFGAHNPPWLGKFLPKVKERGVGVAFAVGEGYDDGARGGDTGFGDGFAAGEVVVIAEGGSEVEDGADGDWGMFSGKCFHVPG